MPSSNALWWLTDRADQTDLASRLAEFAAGSGRYTARGADDYAVAWAYQRDYLIARFGGLQSALAIGPDGFGGRFDHFGDAESVPSPNIVKSAVDTAAAWLVTEAPPLACRASGAPFEAQAALERYGAALDALFNLPSIAGTMEMVGRDGLLRGVGFAMPSYEFGEVVMRRLLPWQISVDPVDARAKSPRVMLVRDTMDRESLIAWIKQRGGDRKTLDRLRDMPAYSAGPRTGRDQWTVYDYELNAELDVQASDHLALLYGWRASTAPGANDGRFVLLAAPDMTGAGGVVVIDEDYEPTVVGPAWWSPYPSDEGIWGTGLGHVLLPWQEALDRSFYKVQRTLDKHGHAKLIVSDSVAGEMNLQSFEQAGITVLVSNAAAGDRDIPTLIVPQVLSRDDIEWIERILQWSTSIYGINQLMQQGVSGAMPTASGAALVERAEQTLDRFADVTRRWSAFRLACGDRMLRLLDGVVAANPDYQASYEVRGVPRRESWADLTKQAQGMAIRLEVRGEAALSRAGRLARAVEWGERGFITPDEQRELMMDDPDLRKAARETLAPERLVEYQIQGVIAANDGDWWQYQPDEDTPLDIAIAKALAMIQRAKVEGADDETIERLREYRLLAEMMLEQQQPAPTGMPADAAMPAVEGAPPPMPAIPL